MPTCLYFEPGPLPRCHATEEASVPSIRDRERWCLRAPLRCPMLSAVRATGRRIGPTLYGLLTLPIASRPGPTRSLLLRSRKAR